MLNWLVVNLCTEQVTSNKSRMKRDFNENGSSQRELGVLLSAAGLRL